ncbi:MAG: hypothetical protein AAGJ18_12905 [Bacteroidota bacterium]
MRISLLFKPLFFIALTLLVACDKDSDESPSLEGTYDIFGYSIIGCEDFDVVLDNEKETCSVIQDLEFCVDGTITFTADRVTINLDFTVDGESDGDQIATDYTVEGDKITFCFEPDDCETNNFKLENGVVEISSPDGEDCQSVLRARKR